MLVSQAGFAITLLPKAPAAGEDDKPAFAAGQDRLGMVLNDPGSLLLYFREDGRCFAPRLADLPSLARAWALSGPIKVTKPLPPAAATSGP